VRLGLKDCLSDYASLLGADLLASPLSKGIVASKALAGPLKSSEAFISMFAIATWRMRPEEVEACLLLFYPCYLYCHGITLPIWHPLQTCCKFTSTTSWQSAYSITNLTEGKDGNQVSVPLQKLTHLETSPNKP
jgi:hypothetical protein